MDTPNNHQGMFLPERKNSFAEEPAFLEVYTPINMETTKKASIMPQSSIDIFIGFLFFQDENLCLFIDFFYFLF
ncbi:hypothetical protein P872_05580 [Rhodonellum psychrophilum GCM71 = DSM 17998]|uniref:Uncharacterized protein n=1 Tax=Rhodonellum psychrophilum GCM71 = DSM 17998 TaxID=1123057 RepID=U5BYK7_9BACT|nr:hypothetical protein P872_05580 [Rhodonellum psychrophilum GCM71 = DSM 17998]